MASHPDKLRDRLAAVTRANHGTFRGFVRATLAQIEYVAGRLRPHTQLEGAPFQRLVFVCLGNINRSAFAEQVARQLGCQCASFGLSTTTGAPAFHMAIANAPHFGVDLSHHKATDMKDYRFDDGDLLLVMEVRHARRLVAAGIPERSIALLGHWASPQRIHLHDPHKLSDAYFRTCFTLIRSAVHGLAHDLRQTGSPCVPK
jgi:protein-tyrosine phosphatase